MARKATKTTYGIETVAGVKIRRLVKAGRAIPDHYVIEDETAYETFSPTGSMVIGVQPKTYPGADIARDNPTTEGYAEPTFLEGEALIARAKELDIKGRSSMSADELRDAIALAEASQE